MDIKETMEELEHKARAGNGLRRGQDRRPGDKKLDILPRNIYG